MELITLVIEGATPDELPRPCDVIENGEAWVVRVVDTIWADDRQSVCMRLVVDYEWMEEYL